MKHVLSKTLLKTKVIELIANKKSVSLDEARDLFYSSETNKLVDDDETGLYGESPLYVFSLFEKESLNKS